ncbi:MAG: thrombospondin type 3 repeat-containing protein, partial [Acidobacteria bacterium]|nr:thrombospondin type 3 repeat-containing protein [Acidobacteriota bacterium]
FCNFSSETVLEGHAQDNACTPIAGSPAGCSQSGAGFNLRLAVNNGCPAGGGATNECDPDGDGNPNFPRVTNPGSSQTVTWSQWAVSFRDWDQGASPPQAGDGVETNLDPCPTHFTGTSHPNHVTNDVHGSVDSWDPRSVFIQAEDSDLGGTGDGIPNTSTVGNGFSCDPTPSSGSFDEDGDGWQNALDNCPLVSNVNQTQSELLATYSSTAPDGGPKSDGIGDACESGGWTGTQNGVSGVSVTLSSTVSNGHYHVSGIVMPICYDTPTPSKTDADSDGWCAGSGEDDSSALLHPKLDLFVIGGDHDGDGENAWLETFMGIDDATPCSATTTKGDETIDSFMSDFDDSRKTDIFDIILLKPSFFKKATQAGYDKRFDMDGSTKVDIFDIIKLKPNFFQTCSFTPQQ